MRSKLRITGAAMAACILLVTVLPCMGAGTVPAPEKQKVTVNDPQFIPLSDEQVIAKPVRWYYYVLALGVLGGAMGGGGGSGGTEEGTVTVGW